MSITTLNGSAATISAGEYDVTWDSQGYNKVFLELSYVKGTETSVDLTFMMTDLSHPTSASKFYIIKLNATTFKVEKYTCQLDTNITKTVIPIDIADCADKFIVKFKYNGTLTNEGAITAYANYNKYH